MNADSHSSSDLLGALMSGAPKKGRVLDQRHLQFGDYVVALTAVRSPRMPNGIECRVVASRRQPVSIGRGKLVIGTLDLGPGPAWNPVPSFEPWPSLPAGPEPTTTGISAWMGTPEATDVSMLAGYVAGLVLLHSQHKRAERIAARAAQRTGALDATALRHAARGEVPEPVHWLLARHDPSRLLAFSPAGILWLRGLVSAGFPVDLTSALALPALQKPA